MEIIQELVLMLLKRAIQKNMATTNGFLIDGYPRELDQGKRFEAEVAPVERVLYFQVFAFRLSPSLPVPMPATTLRV